MAGALRYLPLHCWHGDRLEWVDLCLSHVRCNQRLIEVCGGPGSARISRSTSTLRSPTIDAGLCATTIFE
jgi:hypothetical protein